MAENQRAAEVRAKLHQRLDEDARKALVQQLERYDSMTMSDKDAANVAAVLLTAATNAAALVPDTDRDSGQSVPTVLMEPQSEDERPEVVLDGSGTV